ncbi:MAG: NADH-quinone oxidoreductase subunit N [Syntrophomonadaceae bacterium]|nr:NADH-quinone oxidoreductase subunit N [Syntrophomonadaceae bacterium]
MQLSLIAPEIFVAVLAFLILLLGTLVPRNEQRGLGVFAIVGLAVAIVIVSRQFYQLGDFLGGMYLIDGYSAFFKLLFLAAALLICLTVGSYDRPLAGRRGEFYVLVLFATLGMMIMVSAGELITLYVGLELATISFYVLTANLAGEDARSSEAGLKYLVLGAVSSAILLYGLSLLYGVTGTTAIQGIARTTTLVPAFWLGLVFVLAGLGFKVAAVPFHMWAPDIYEGAPTPVTAFLAVASKAAGFAVFVRLFLAAFAGYTYQWIWLVAALAAVTMVFGNLVAIPQQNIKRMLAYSSIAQAGYLLVGLVAANQLGIKGILFYSAAYVFANVGAFAVAIAFSRYTESDHIADYAGLSRRSPLLAVTMVVCLLSLAGLPPFAGYAGKFYLFMAVIDRGYIWLALIGMVMSMVSVYYYLSVARVMFVGGVADYRTVKIDGTIKAALYICLIGTVLIGCYPEPLSRLASQAARLLF